MRQPTFSSPQTLSKSYAHPNICLFDIWSYVWDFAGSFFELNGGKQAALSYRQAVLTTFREVEDELATMRKLHPQSVPDGPLIALLALVAQTRAL
jgi:hypothetical protein